MFGIVMLGGMILHLVLGIKGLKKLISEKPPLKIFLTLIFSILILPLIYKIGFFGFYSEERIANLSISFLIIYSSLIIFSVPALIFSKVNTNISRMLYSCLLTSLIYSFIIDKYLIEYFNISTYY